MNTDSSNTEDDWIKTGTNLLSQQLWCWGCDIVRSEGNWLLKIGFERQPPPRELFDCSSVYTLRLPFSGCVVLRGFGVFYGKKNLGGVFLPRYEFHPKYTPLSSLVKPPWNSTDLPEFTMPLPSQRKCFAVLTLELVDWIRAYEVNVIKQLGMKYRKSTLKQWADGKRHVVPAEQMASAWRSLGTKLAECFQTSPSSRLSPQTDSNTS